MDSESLSAQREEGRGLKEQTAVFRALHRDHMTAQQEAAFGSLPVCFNSAFEGKISL